MKEDKTYKTFILNGEKEEEVVGLDTHSFEYFKAMCDCWSKEDLQYRAWEICVECIEKDKEIERLNNIIDLKSSFIQDLLELIHYSNDNDLHTKVHLTGIEYQEKLRELKEGK